MRFRWHRRYGAALLILAFVLSWRLSRTSQEETTVKVHDASVSTDYYLKRFTATQVDLNDQGRYTLTGEEMLHFAGAEGLATLKRPHIRYTKEGDAPWTADALNGVLLEQDQRVRLQDDVRIDYAGDNKRERLTIYSDNMEFLIPDSFAETRDAVRIEQPEGETRAVGLQLDLLKRRMTLISDVRSRYLSTDHDHE